MQELAPVGTIWTIFSKNYVLCFDMTSGSLRINSRAWLCFSCFGASQGWSGFLGSVCWKHLKANVLATATWGLGNANNRQIKKPGKEVAWEGDTWRNKVFGKLPDISGSLRVHTHTQRWTHTQKRCEETQRFHLWLTFMFHVSRKWRLKQSCK